MKCSGNGVKSVAGGPLGQLPMASVTPQSVLMNDIFTMVDAVGGGGFVLFWGSKECDGQP